MALEGIYLGTQASTQQWRTDQGELRKFRSQVEASAAMLGPQGQSEDWWVQFLMREVDPIDSELLRRASGTSSIDQPEHHLEVASRAALLLRLATGAWTRLLSSAGLRRQDVRFWWGTLAEERGLWEPGQEPADLLDLWADVEDALRGVIAWESACDAGETSESYASLLGGPAREIVTLGGCERILLWAFKA